MSIAIDMFIKCMLTTTEFTDYFSIPLHGKSCKEASLYLTRGRHLRMLRYLTTAEAMNIMTQKERFLSVYGREFVKRDWLFISEATTNEDISSLVKNHPQFIAKPQKMNAGRGIELVDSAGHDGTDSLLLYLKIKNLTLLEERVSNHEVLAKFSVASLNTIRMLALRHPDGIKILYALLRFNTKGAIADNIAAGGLGCLIDPETGKIINGVMDKHGEEFFVPEHPFGFNVVGMEIPFWKEAVELVEKATLFLPNLCHVPWDIAITPEGPLIIEGNVLAGHGFQKYTGKPAFKDMKIAYDYAKKLRKGR